MSKSLEHNINRYWKLLFLNTIFLLVIIIGGVSLKQYTFLKKDMEVFREELIKHEKEKIYEEVHNRLDEIKYIQATFQDKFHQILIDEVKSTEILLSQLLANLPSNYDLGQKRNAFIDFIYEHDIYDDDYMYFVLDLEGNIYLSGTTKSIEGTNILHLKDKITGRYFIQDMINVINTNEENEGFITYHWIKEDNGKHSKKTSYITYNDEVELFFGTGIYDEDFENSVKEEFYKSIFSYYKNSKEYIFIVNYDGTALVHSDENIIGKDISNYPKVNEKSLFAIVMDMLEEKDGGFLEYSYFENGKPTDQVINKISYFVAIDEWDVYMGQGFSTDGLKAIEKEHMSKQYKNFYIFIFSGIIITLIFGYVIGTYICKILKQTKMIFENKQNQIEKASYTDFLTNTYNRKYIDIILNKISYPYTVIMADINGLKLINDAYGHLVGDEVLIVASQIFMDVIKDKGTIIRWGGDEFIIILEDYSQDNTLKIINDIKSKYNQIMIKDANVSISFGYTIIDENTDFDQSLKEAEDMMYQRKIFESKSMKAKIIDNIINTLNINYQYEKDHVDGVKIYATMLGEKLSLDAEEINKIGIASLLHDIGKIGISDSLLNKVEPLTDEEFEEIRQHPAIGYRILSAYSELSEFASVVLHHHERWDGKGYPEGLKGEDIPLKARIISIADSYDAMISERAYKKAMTKDEAIEELIKNKGTQFDPKLVDIFVDILRDETI